MTALKIKLTRNKLFGKSIYAEIGGEEALRIAIDKMFERLVVDETVRHFFIGMRTERIKEKVFESLQCALGGAIQESDIDLKKAHRNLVIEATHFDVMANYFNDSLNESGVCRAASRRATKVFKAFKPFVVNQRRSSK